MTADFNKPPDLIVALDYLGSVVGTETTVHLRSIARALRNITWDIPEPHPSVYAGLYYYPQCGLESAVAEAEKTVGRKLETARRLLEDQRAPHQPRKICLIHREAGFTAGYELVAAKAGEEVIPFDAASLDDSAVVMKTCCNGYACLFIKG